MQKISLIILILVAAPMFLFSQMYIESKTLNDFINIKNLDKLLNGEDANKNIQGSPYDTDEFQKGYIVSKNKHKFSDVMLRFNIYNNVIDFKNEDNKIYTLSMPELFEFFMIGEQKYKYFPYSINKKIKKAYFKVIVEGKALLLLKERVIFKEATEPAAYKEAEPAKFNRASGEYYIQVGTREAQRVGSKKDLVAILSSSVEGFIKKNKIKPSKEEDLKKLIEHYNKI